MKTRLLLLSILIASVAVCHYQGGPSSSANHTTDGARTSNKRRSVIESPANGNGDTLAQASDGQQASARAAFRSVLSDSKNEKFEQASVDFERLCDKWNPVGRSVEEVKQIVGIPDSETRNSISYLFHGGTGGWEWRLSIVGNKVTGLRRYGFY